MKKIYILMVIPFLLIIFAGAYLQRSTEVRESITFFPIDPQAAYIDSGTHLQLHTVSAAGYSLLWTVSSTLDRKAYLRQDLGFLFSNGKLIEKMADWKQNTGKLNQSEQLEEKNSALFQAVSFHHSELHKQNGQIFSSQSLSQDRLYVIPSAASGFSSFRNAGDYEQNSWKQKLDEQTRSLLEHAWNKGIRHFSIRLENYQAYPLDLFHEQAKKGLPGFTKEESEKLIGNLWEGLYKNYALGIREEDGTTVNPLGSTLPLILLANNKTHLLVLTETATGKPALLRQSIGAPD